jgi:hypothetical protein
MRRDLNCASARPIAIPSVTSVETFGDHRLNRQIAGHSLDGQLGYPGVLITEPSAGMRPWAAPTPLLGIDRGEQPSTVKHRRQYASKTARSVA